MSHFKTVSGFMGAVPPAMQHEEIYRQHLAAVYNDIANVDLDLSVWESGTVGLGERNILKNLVMPDKFILTNMDEKCEIETGSWSKQKGQDLGKGSLSHEITREETFLMEGTIQLKPRPTVMTDSRKPGVQMPANEPLHRKLMAALKGIRPSEMSGVALAYVGERLVTKQDLRHVFLKGYLMTMSYNLAVSSGRTEYEFDDLKYIKADESKPSNRVVYLMKQGVVINECHFTKEEMWVLVEMCDEYPKKRFGDANIYNNISVAKDDLVVFTDNPGVSYGDQPGYGSPERLWSDIVNIAMKFGALDDLAEVVRSMRGVPGLLREVNELTGRDCFMIDYPRSYSVELAIAGLEINTPRVTRHSGYYATGKCLVADLLMSKMMVMSVYNVIEELGAFSCVGMPSGKADKDELFNSTLLNRGVKSENEEENCLLQEWRGIRQGKMCVGFGGKLKDMAIGMANEIRSGKYDRLRPQLLHSLPYSRCRNTTWGTIRGWKFKEFSFSTSRAQRIMETSLLRAYCWMMGVTSTVPKVGMNHIGAAFNEVLSNAEVKFTLLAGGEYELVLVRNKLNGVFLPRVDDIELSSDNFYSSGFPGTRCTVVFDEGGDVKIVVEEGDGSLFNSMSTIGADDPKKKPSGEEDAAEFPTFGGSRFKRAAMAGKPITSSSEAAADPNVVFGETPVQEVEGEVDLESIPFNEESRRGVEMGKKKPYVLNINPREIRDGSGVPVPKVAMSIDGEEILVPAGNCTADGEGGSFSGYILPTPGGGQCGLHSVIKELQLRGYIDARQGEDAFLNMGDEMVSTSWHAAVELAAYLNNLSFGLVVVEDDHQTVQRFGTKSSIHNVWVHHEKGHYSTFIPMDGKGKKYIDYAVVNEQTTPEQMLEAIDFQIAMLDGNWVNSRLRNKRSELKRKLGIPEPEGYNPDGSEQAGRRNAGVGNSRSKPQPQRAQQGQGGRGGGRSNRWMSHNRNAYAG